MKRIPSILAVAGLGAVFCWSSVLGAPKKNAAVPVKAAESIVWVNTFAEGMKKAKETGKPALIDFYADWCGWCKKLDRDVYTDPQFIARSKEYVCIKVNTDNEQGPAQAFGVQGLPTILFVSADGKTVLKEVVGYRTSGDFVKIMDALRGKK